jgi:diacylglycerol kinase (ATP)
MERPKLTGPARIHRSIRVSWSGFKYAVVNEAAIREQVVAIAVLVPTSLAVPVTRLEHLLLVLALMMVLMVEFLNTAVEATVDRISLDEHPLAGRAKDLANVAVVISVLMMALSWVVILGPVVTRWLL